MSAPVCDWCSSYIDSANRRHPGYCSPICAEFARLERDQIASDLARRRADRQERRADAARGWFAS